MAALYDIHGNLPALEAVLEAVRSEGVDGIVVGGDVVPGPLPRESLAALSGLPAPARFLRGNGESDLVGLSRGEPRTRFPESLSGTMHWVLEELGPEPVSRFATWPLTIRFDIAGLGRVLFCHATPRDDNEIFTRLTAEDRLRPVFEAAGADLVVCGHTHMPFDRTIGSVRVINAGSVGMPFGAPGAYWALLDGRGVEFRRTSYDLDAATERLQASAYPGEPLALHRPPDEAEMLEKLEAAALR